MIFLVFTECVTQSVINQETIHREATLTVSHNSPPPPMMESRNRDGPEVRKYY